MSAEPLPKPRSKEIEELDTGTIEPELLLKPADEAVLRRFDELKHFAEQLFEQLRLLERNIIEVPAPAETLRPLLQKIRAGVDRTIGSTLPALFNYNVSKLSEIYALRERQEEYVRNLAETHGRLEDALDQLQTANTTLGKIADSLPYRARRAAGKLFRLLKEPGRIPGVVRSRGALATRRLRDAAPMLQAGSPGNQDTRRKKQVRSFSEEHGHHRLRSPYGDVDNTGTPMSIFENWVTVFCQNGRQYGSSEPLVSDNLPTITELNTRFPLAGRHVLELGPLEGGNTKQMIDLGAASVTGIESARESFVKCLLMKNTFLLDGADFIFGDCNEIMKRNRIGRRSSFDICVASGLLYHMENPIECIDNITSIAPAAYVWSHVASERSPLGDWTEIVDREGRVYRGRKNQYKETDVLGGIGYTAVWLTPESMQQAFVDRGFEIDDIGEVSNYKGDAVQFIAKKRP